MDIEGSSNGSDDSEINYETSENKVESKTFERKIENFECEECHTSVKGDGYTDHCPNCLTSKHVDVFPGDRASDCKGIMKPVAAEVKKDEYKIHYECEKCGYKHKVRSSPNDNFDAILPLVGKPF